MLTQITPLAHPESNTFNTEDAAKSDTTTTTVHLTNMHNLNTGPSTPQEREQQLHPNKALLDALKRKTETPESSNSNKMLKPSKPIKHISLLGTGGTIAGAAKSKTQTSGYQAGAKNSQELLQEVIHDLNLPEHVQVDAQDVFQIDSKNLTDQHLITLAKTVTQELEKPDVHGLVITHGTDTLAASAFFLNLTIPSDKPVVLVGSMRPSTALSTEGPMNLNAAIRLAKSNKAKGNGVMVMANDKVLAARDVSKQHTTNVAAFQASNSGPLAVFANNKFFFHSKPVKKHTTNSAFNAKHLPATLPTNYTLHAQVEDPQITTGLIDHLIAQNKVRSIVYAGTGDGTMHTEIENKLRDAASAGILVVRASKTGAGPVVHNGAVKDSEAGFISANTLNPDQSALLSKLALSQHPAKQPINKETLKHIQTLFNTY